jgi:hypothetical protein
MWRRFRIHCTNLDQGRNLLRRGQVRQVMNNGSITFSPFSCLYSSYNFVVSAPRTPQPAVEPTRPPTYEPTLLPTKESRLDCLLDVSATCRLMNGADCGALQPRKSNCGEKITYELKICNVGPIEATVTTASFIFFNMMAVDLLGSLPVNPIPRGRCVSVAPARDVDVCIDQELFSSVTVEAIPPNGAACMDDETFVLKTSSIPDTTRPTLGPSTRPTTKPTKFPTPRPTNTLTKSPTPRPSPKPTSFPTHGQTERPTNTATQGRTPRPSLPTIRQTVKPTSAPTPLSTIPYEPCVSDVNILCRLGSTGTDCSTIEPRQVDCSETAVFDIEVCNVGSVELTVQSAKFQFNGTVTDLAPNLPQGPLPVGQCMALTIDKQVDACSSRDYFASFEVDASPPNGDSCLDISTYGFATVALPSPITEPIRPLLARPLNAPPVSGPESPPTEPIQPPIIPVAPLSPGLPDLELQAVSPDVEPTTTAPVAPTPREACDLDVTLQCSLMNGMACQDVVPPPTRMCAEATPVSVLGFSYQNSDCNASGKCTNDLIANSAHSCWCCSWNE